MEPPVRGDVLALDGGQSGVRTALVVDGAVVSTSEHPGLLTDRPVLPQLAAAVAVATARAGRAATTFAAGVSGLGDDETAAHLLALLAPQRVERVFLAHDSVTSYVGAVGAERGVVTAAGTGVVTLAVGERLVTRVDGWGNLIGDAGAGFWIGRAALEAVMRAFDGRGPATSLTPLAVAEFTDLPDAYLQLQADEFRVSRIAKWATAVSEHAAAGDQVCCDISVRAAHELAHSALTGLRVVGEDDRPDPLVSEVGKVFLNPLLRWTFEDAVRQAFPAARIVAPRGTGLDGAALLPSVDESSALFARIDRA